MRTYRESFSREDGRKGITQSELLRKMGRINPYYGSISSHGTVSRWESGETHPTIERIETFGMSLNLSEEEIKGMILLAGLAPGPREAKALSCPACGGETEATVNKDIQDKTGEEPVTTIATRTRRCLSCKYTAESTERWSDDPREAGNLRLQRALNQIGDSNEQIRQALREANTIPQPEDPENGL